jgi:hypothetical protein
MYGVPAAIQVITQLLIALRGGYYISLAVLPKQ